MPELYIFSQDDELVTIITEDTGLVSAPVRIEVNSVPDTPFSFTVEADSENAQYVKEENKVVYRDHEGDLRLVVIKEIDDVDSIDGPMTTAICEPEFMELTENIIVDRRFTDRTAQFMLDAALENTRYVGVVEVELGLGSTNFYYLNSVEAIWKIIEVMGGEFKDIVEFDENNNIVARKIKLLQRLGSDTGQRFEIDHNITEIGRTVLSYPKTAMYGRGSSLPIEDEEGEHTGGFTRYIDFAEVEWKKSNGDPVDKPRGQRWVGDPEALQVYGRTHDGKKLHRFGIFSNQDYEDPKELLWATWQNLQANNKPEVNYRLSIDLFDDKVSLGDTAIAIDRYFARPIEIQARIIAMEYDLLDIDGTMVVEMGQFLDLEDTRIDDLENEVERIKSRPAQVTENSYPNRKPSTPVNVRAVGAFGTIQLYWDYADELFIKHYEVYGSQVADFVPDTQHLLWRGQVSAFGHTVNTDETWYYYVRAVNYHGTPSDWSARVSASTVRIISDDILFGPDIAEELRELSKTAQLLADGTVDLSIIGADVEAEINGAKTEASNAQSRAEDAYNNAQSALDNAQTAFESALATALAVDDFAIRLEDTEDNITTLIQTAQGLQREVSNKVDTSTFTQLADVVDLKITKEQADGWYTSQSQFTLTVENLQSTISGVRYDLDGLEVSEINLVLKSNTANESSAYRITGYDMSIDWTTGETWTVVIKGELNDDQRFGIWANGSSTNQTYLTNLGNGYHKSTFTVRTPTNSGTNSGPKKLNVYNYPSATAKNAKIEWIKLVRANKTSLSWSPAPEDMATQSQITQLSDNINARVEKDDVINQINISTEGILIDGRKVRITGQTTIDNAVIKTAHIADAAINSAKIANLAVGTAAIADGAITRLKLGTAVVGTAQIADAAITNAKIASVDADKVNATSLAAITADLGTVRSGRLLSNNNNMDLNLNTGNLTMRNANLTISNGASINFEDPGNTLTYRKYDSTDGLTRSAGLGVGDRIGGRYPFAYLGATGASNLNSLSPYFSGFIANSTAATGEDNAANSVNGWRFQMRSTAVDWVKGITFDFNGNPKITMIGGNSYNYDIGPLYTIFGKQLFNIRNYYNERSGWILETNYSGTGSDITFRGQYGANYNYQIGGNSTSNAIRNIYLRNNPIVVSDRRAKEDIDSNKLGLDFINSIQTRMFRLKQKPSETERNKLQFGFIAQELIDSLQTHGIHIEDYSIIGKGEDGLYNLKETQMIAPTIRAVQELDDKVIDLQVRIDSRIDNLEKEVVWLKTEKQLLKNEISILKNHVQQLEEKVA